MRHTCHAEACPVPVPRRMFMCSKHWFTLPKPMRDEVWAVYTEGQERDPSLVTSEYLEVTRRCIDFVATKEGRRG